MRDFATFDIQFIERGLETRSGGNRFGISRIGCDGLLLKWGIFHVEKLARVIQLPFRLAHIPVPPKLHENPLARGAFFTFQY